MPEEAGAVPRGGPCAAPRCHGAGRCEARPPHGRTAAGAAVPSSDGCCCPSSVGDAWTRSGCAVCSADTAAPHAAAGVSGFGGLRLGPSAAAEGLASSRPSSSGSPEMRGSRSLIPVSMPSSLRPDGSTSTARVPSLSRMSAVGGPVGSTTGRHRRWRTTALAPWASSSGPLVIRRFTATPRSPAPSARAREGTPRIRERLPQRAAFALRWGQDGSTGHLRTALPCSPG